MSKTNRSPHDYEHGEHEPSDREPRPDDEGGLRAPPHLTGWRKAWWWFDFIILVKLARLRFIAVLVIIGAVITQWDLLAAYYDRWTRPIDEAHVGEDGGGEAHGSGGDVEWFCPMHPSVVRDNPKDKCPVCFMPLSKRKKSDAQAEALPAGTVNRVQLSPYRVVLAGVETWKLDYVPLVKDITAIGYVDFDERGQRTVSARVKGRIDKLFVNQTGQMVAAGEVLASLYSPELNVTVQNLVDAKRNGSPELLRSARNRLQLLGISDDQLDEVLATGKANTHLNIRSPISGHVIKKYVREGQYVDEGTPLYDVADLSTVWIQAQVYEDDMSFLPPDPSHSPEDSAASEVAVTATTLAFPSEPFQGKLAFIYPHVDEATRTVTVRVELPNPDHKLRPGTTAAIHIHVPASSLKRLEESVAGSEVGREMLSRGMVLAVPDSSVIDTGSRQIVYRQASPGVFEGVKVELGPKMTSPEGIAFYPVLQGLEPGERVVTSGSFLVDAETRLNPAAGSIYFGGSSGSKSSPSSMANVRPSTPDDPEAMLTAELAKLSDEDRRAVDLQKYCPILQSNKLGSMGPPVKIALEGQNIFLCCEGCKDAAMKNPAATLAKVKALKGKRLPGGQPMDPMPTNP